MKTLISYAVVTVFVLASSFTIDVQQNLNKQSTNTTASFDFFRIHRQGKNGVAATWACASADVAKFILERSYDEYNYEPVGSVDCNASHSYKLVDNNAYPGDSFYRVTAIKTDGSTETSVVEKIRVVRHQ